MQLHDVNHKPITDKNIKIIVNKANSSVSAKDIIFDYNRAGSTNITVYGGTLGNVSVVDHPEVEPILSDTIVTVFGLTPGNYKLQVITDPDESHASVTRFINIIVNEASSTVSGKDIVFDWGTSGNTTLTVVGGSIAKVSVVDHSDIKPVLSGNVVTVSGLNAGTYYLEVITSPDLYYRIATDRSIKIIVNKIDSSVSGDDFTFNYGSTGSTTLTVIGGTIGNVSVVGHDEANVDLDGNTVYVSGLDEGIHYLRVITNPDANYNSVSKTIKITVTKSGGGQVNPNPGILLPSTIRLNSITCYYGSSGSTTITNLNGGTVNSTDISVDGHPEINPKLAGNKITVSGLKVGTYTLRVKTTPYDGYYSVTESVSITVKKIPAVIKASAWSDYSKSKKVWKIKLTNSKTKKPLANMQIVLKVYKGGKLEKTIKRKTNSKGEVSLKLSSWKVGKYTVKISFSKTGYTCKPISKTVKVLKPTKLTFTVKSKAVLQFPSGSRQAKNLSKKALKSTYMYLTEKNLSPWLQEHTKTIKDS